MKIGFDASMLVYQGSGVATYTYNLIKNLLLIDKKNEYHIFYSSFRRPKGFHYLKSLKQLGGIIHNMSFPPRVLKYWWNAQHMMPVEWFIGKVDIYHSSDFLRPPLLANTKGITTIHDVTWKVYPEFHTQDIIDAHNRKMQRTIRYNDVIIADSIKTKEDINYYYPECKNNIVILPLGIDEQYFQKHTKQDIHTVLAKYKIPSPYILYVGAIEPRKNLVMLIRAFHEVLKTHNDLHLVLAGRAGWKNEEVFSTIKSLQLNEKIHITGYVEENDLPKLYQGAKLFVYPSLYEGFGLPPLESLASGTPIVAYNSPSLSSIFVKNVDEEMVTNDILYKLQNPILEEIKIYSWEEAASKVLELYKEVV